MPSQLVAKVKAALAGVQAEGQALGSASPLAVVIDNFADALASPIYNKIVVLLNYRPQTGRDYQEMLQLHGEIVRFFESKRTGSFNYKDLAVYQQDYKKKIEADGLKRQIRQADDLFTKLDRAEMKCMDNIFDGSTFDKSLDEIDSEFDAWENAMKGGVRCANASREAKEKLQRISYDQRKIDGFFSNQDAKYNPSNYLARFNEWRAKELVRLTKETGINLNRLVR